MEREGDINVQKQEQVFPDRIVSQVSQIRNLAEAGAFDVITEDNFKEVSESYPDWVYLARLYALSVAKGALVNLLTRFPQYSNEIKKNIEDVDEEFKKIIKKSRKTNKDEEILHIDEEQEKQLKGFVELGLEEFINESNFPFLSRLSKENLALLKIMAISKKIKNVEGILNSLGTPGRFGFSRSSDNKEIDFSEGRKNLEEILKRLQEQLNALLKSLSTEEK